MNFHVSWDGRLLPEALPADRALEGFIIAVDIHVFLEVDFIAAALPADRALVEFLLSGIAFFPSLDLLADIKLTAARHFRITCGAV